MIPFFPFFCLFI